jgi:Tfp pilus assembly protein PilV
MSYEYSSVVKQNTTQLWNDIYMWVNSHYCIVSSGNTNLKTKFNLTDSENSWGYDFELNIFQNEISISFHSATATQRKAILDGLNRILVEYNLNELDEM